MRLERLEGAAVAADGASIHARHQGDRRPVEIGVEQADRGTLLRQCDREVERDGALAHAALPRAHQHHVLDLREQAVRLPLGPADLRAKAELDLRHPGDRSQGGFHVGADAVAQRAGRCGEVHLQRNPAALDPHILDHVQGDEVAVEFRILDPGQRLHHLLDGRLAHHLSHVPSV